MLKGKFSLNKTLIVKLKCNVQKKTWTRMWLKAQGFGGPPLDDFTPIVRQDILCCDVFLPMRQDFFFMFTVLENSVFPMG